MSGDPLREDYMGIAGRTEGDQKLCKCYPREPELLRPLPGPAMLEAGYVRTVGAALPLFLLGVGVDAAGVPVVYLPLVVFHPRLVALVGSLLDKLAFFCFFYLCY
ncbi:unnamed protein product [Ectocarpus sp. 8 AP-2014]